jgi:hypothetical protein
MGVTRCQVEQDDASAMPSSLVWQVGMAVSAEKTPMTKRTLSRTVVLLQFELPL